MIYMGNILMGMFISFIVYLNGQLAGITNNFFSLLAVHLIGLLSAVILKIVYEKKKIKLVSQWYLYLGGILSLMIIFLENMSINNIGVSMAVLFITIGQLLFSFIIDHFGLFERNIFRFSLKKSFGLVLIIAGIIFINL